MTIKLPASGWELPKNQAISSLMGSLSNQVDQLSKTRLLKQIADYQTGSSKGLEDLTPNEMLKQSALAGFAAKELPEYASLIDARLNPFALQEVQDKQRTKAKERFDVQMADSIKPSLEARGLKPAQIDTIGRVFIRPELWKHPSMQPKELNDLINKQPGAQAIIRFFQNRNEYADKNPFVQWLTGGTEQDKIAMGKLLEEGRRVIKDNPQLQDVVFDSLNGISKNLGSATIAAGIYNGGDQNLENVPYYDDKEAVDKWISANKEMKPQAAKALLLLKWNKFKHRVSSPHLEAEIQKVIDQHYGNTPDTSMASRITTVGRYHYFLGSEDETTTPSKKKKAPLLERFLRRPPLIPYTWEGQNPSSHVTKGGKK